MIKAMINIAGLSAYVLREHAGETEGVQALVAIAEQLERIADAAEAEPGPTWAETHIIRGVKP